ncbi:hypothetical protein TCAL_01978 [Tigriopus californicus]|uniref:Uncharacterized protein n=1 Tax=Tigriopus californicus TaxID=6832 RepID=A0A553PNJ2_TIGCA|nr:hypothetical protein TCAL_01978 [Tigriopus californicus]
MAPILELKRNVGHVENLQKSLKDISHSSPNSIKSRLAQVRELEQEVHAVDNELTSIVKEREENNRRLNTKKVHHISTLQELGKSGSISGHQYHHRFVERKTRYQYALLTGLLGNDTGASSDGNSVKWRSEMDLQGSPESFTSLGGGSNRASPLRKVSPPFPFAAAKFLAESRIRSGSDPALTLKKATNGSLKKSNNNKNNTTTTTNTNTNTSTSGSNQDENKKPFSSMIRKSVQAQVKSSPDSSPRAGRRNPLRMLSNAIDFRGKRRNQRPKSVECGRDYIHDHPTGSKLTHNPKGINSVSTSDLVIATPTSPRLLKAHELDDIFGMGVSRHSLPNLDPLDIQEAMTRVHGEQSIKGQSSVSGYATNPRPYKIKQNPHNLPPLENRNSAPEIVVTAHVNGNAGRRGQGGLEERINRAKARVQSGFNHFGSGPNLGSTACPIPLHGPKPKLSSRFQSAQKLNSKFLNNFSNSVKRSRTFNISDVQEELATLGLSKTLPRKHKTRKTSNKSGRHSVESSPENGAAYSYGSSTMSFDSSSTASSRKSSNSSTNNEEASSSRNFDSYSSASSSTTNQNLRTEVSEQALAEIAAWEMFAQNYFSKLEESNPNTPNDVSLTIRRVESGQDREISGTKPPRKLSTVEIKDLEI